jgi:hypothetical protein
MSLGLFPIAGQPVAGQPPATSQTYSETADGGVIIDGESLTNNGGIIYIRTPLLSASHSNRVLLIGASKLLVAR